MKVVLGVVVALVSGTSGFPMEPRPLPLGSRVRITSPQVGVEPLIGTLVGLESGAVVVRRNMTDPPSRIAIAAISTLEVSGGRKSQAGRGALIGAAVGTVPGLLLTFGDYSSDTHGDGPSPMAVAAMGAAGGALLGAAVGWALKSEVWLPPEMPAVAAGLAPLPGGGVGVALRVAWGSSPAHGR